MKKFLFALLAWSGRVLTLALVFALASCGGASSGPSGNGSNNTPGDGDPGDYSIAGTTWETYQILGALCVLTFTASTYDFTFPPHPSYPDFFTTGLADRGDYTLNGDTITMIVREIGPTAEDGTKIGDITTATLTDDNHLFVNTTYGPITFARKG